jgi:hypothetical protein
MADASEVGHPKSAGPGWMFVQSVYERALDVLMTLGINAVRNPFY